MLISTQWQWCVSLYWENMKILILQISPNPGGDLSKECKFFRDEYRLLICKKYPPPVMPKSLRRCFLGRHLGDDSGDSGALTGRLPETDTWRFLRHEPVGTKQHNHQHHMEFTASLFQLPDLAAHTNTFHVKCNLWWQMSAGLLFTKMSLLRCPAELPVCLGLNVEPKLCFSCQPRVSNVMFQAQQGNSVLQQPMKWI